MQNVTFHPNSDVPTTYKPGNKYTCGACGTKDSLHISYNSDREVIGKCYSDTCYL